MNWYYADQGQRMGPIEETELDQLVSAGSVAPSSLIWTLGMGNWQPYSVVKAARFKAAPGGYATTLLAADHCTSCGREIQPQESIIVGKSATCADCKPMFVERLREADLVTLPGKLPYSGFWIRYVARMADYTLLTVVQSLFTGGLLLWAIRRKSADPGEMLAVFGITTLLGLVVSCAYETYMIGSRGATIGKMLCYLKVVRADGSKLTMSAALGRYGAELMSRMSGGVGYLMAAFDSEKRSLHDRVAGTRVVDAGPVEFRRELQPVDHAIRCGHCRTEFPPTEWNAYAPLPCPGCGTPLQAIIFLALARTLPPQGPQAIENEGEAGCYYHDANRASITCDDCGRFLCSLCDFDAGARHICPGCFNGHYNTADLPEYASRRTLYDSIALSLAILPNLFLFTIYFTLFTAPAVVGLSLWSWKKPGSITPREEWRFVVALLIAGLNILFIGLLFVALLASAFK